MADEETIALYGAIKKLANAMTAREKTLERQMAELDQRTAALSEKTAALNGVIAELKQLPATLGRHTSQYIGEGVRKAIQDDFSRPIAEAVKGPIAELDYAAHQARAAIADIRSESKFQSWTWVAIMIILGIAIGVTGHYFFYMRDVGRIDDRLDSIQRQIAPPAPASDPKPADGKTAKGRKGR